MSLRLFRYYSCILLLFINNILCGTPRINVDEINKQNLLENKNQVWIDIEKYESENLPKSALKLVDNIIEVSQNKNSQFYVRGVLKKINYLHQLSASYSSSIRYLQDVIRTSNPIEKSIFYSTLADLYLKYYKNTYDFGFKTDNLSPKEAILDISHCSKKQILDSISYCLSQSLNPWQKLQNVSADKYRISLNKSSELTNRDLKENLYDLLFYKTLDLYKDNFSWIIGGFYKKNFSKLYFASVEKFCQMQPDLVNTDPLTKSIAIFFKEYFTHTNAVLQQKYGYADLERIKFIYQNSYEKDKDKYYCNYLQYIYNKYRKYNLAGEILYELGLFFYSQISNPQVVKNKNLSLCYQKAKLCCDSIMINYPNSYGASCAAVLKNKIKSSKVTVEAESIYLTGEKILLKVTHRNLDSLFFKVYKSSQERDSYLSSPEKKWSFERSCLLKLKPFNDYYGHSTELLLDSLPFGSYDLRIYDQKNNSEKSLVSFRVSRIGWILKDDANLKQLAVYFFDRKSGIPLKNTKINIYEGYLDKKNSHADKLLYDTHLDSCGKYVIKYSSNIKKQFIFSIKYRNEVLKVLSRENHRSPNLNKKILKFNNLITDRSIYKPGQTIFFKGIIYEKDYINHKSPQITKIKKNTKIILYDRNNQIIASQIIKINDFGSYSGSFKIPHNILKGVLSIRDSFSNLAKYISVEEYTKPKVRISIDEFTKEYTHGDAVNVTGKVITYGGNMTGNLKLGCTVSILGGECKDLNSCAMNNRAINREILGYKTVTTDSQGNFNFQFKTLANTIQPDFLFYKIAVSLGEGNIGGAVAYQNLTVAKSSLSLSLIGETQISKDHLKDTQIKVLASNLNRSLIPFAGSYEIYKLKIPNKITINRKWSIPEYILIDSVEFNKYFPHYPYHNESSKDSWKKVKVVQGSIKKGNQKINLSRIKEDGQYLIHVYGYDKSGNYISRDKYIHIYDIKNSNIKFIDPLLAFRNDLDNFNDSIAEVVVGSSLENAYVYYELYTNEKILKSEILTFNKEKRMIKIPLLSEYGKGISAKFFLYYENRMYEKSLYFKCPPQKQNLKINLISFKNILTPGKNEKWQIRITDDQGKIVKSEVLAFMFDASLDQLRSYQFKEDFLDGDSYYPYFFTVKYNFCANSYLQRGIAEDKDILKLKRYDYRDYLGSYDEVGGFYKEGIYSKIIPPKNNFQNIDADVLGIKEQAQYSTFKIRKDFNETAFFFPHLYTDRKGNVNINFKMRESLTDWNFYCLAHSKSLKHGTLLEKVSTRKELTVETHFPNFMRERDSICIKSNVSNLSNLSQEGEFKVYISDNKGRVLSSGNNIREKFILDQKSNLNFKWSLKAPEGIDTLLIKVMAIGKKYTDGEQVKIPVIKNKILTISGIPIWSNPKSNKIFNLKEILRKSYNKILSTYGLTITYVQNPLWKVVESLPFVSLSKVDIPSRIMDKHFINIVSLKLLNIYPNLRKKMIEWGRNKQTLSNNLYLNNDLKNISTYYTPWKTQSKQIDSRKDRIRNLLMADSLSIVLSNLYYRLKETQTTDGGWSFRKSQSADLLTTIDILLKYAFLVDFKIISRSEKLKFRELFYKSITYLDKAVRRLHGEKNKARIIDKNLSFSTLDIKYLYIRTVFKDKKNSIKANDIFKELSSKITSNWQDLSYYDKLLLALFLKRHDQENIARVIMLSIREYLQNSEELGLLFRGISTNKKLLMLYFLSIEAFKRILDDDQVVEGLKKALLKRKEVTLWDNSIETALSCYSLLTSYFPIKTDLVNIHIDKNKVSLSKKLKHIGDESFRVDFQGKNSNPADKIIQIDNPNKNISWGGFYLYQWLDIDNLQDFSIDGINIHKKIFKKIFRKEASSFDLIKTDSLSVGDHILVRLEFEVNRDLNFVHIRDMKTGCFKNVDFLSGYKFQKKLSFYQSSHNSSLDFFIDYLPRGKHIIEYEALVSHGGVLNTGITTLQCLYAPAFSVYSKSLKVFVK